MRKMIVPALICLMPMLLVQAQPLPCYEDVLLLRMDYENSQGEQGFTTFFYNRAGNICKSVWTLRDSSRYSQNLYRYESGLLVERWRSFSDGMTSNELYSYDEAGRLIEEKFSRSDGRIGHGVYSYDADGLLVQMDFDKHRGWLTGLVQIEYDGGLKKTARMTVDGQPRAGITYEYDAQGHLIREHWDFGGRFTQTFSYIYTIRPSLTGGFASPFVAMNPLYHPVSEDYDWNNENGGPSYYEYNEQGLLARKRFVRSDGVETLTHYKYNEKGDLVSSHRTYEDGSTVQFEYVTGPGGMLTERRGIHSDGRESVEKYHWDSWGRLTELQYSNMDFWLSGSMKLNYDSWGRLVSGKFISESGYTANVTFNSDPSDNVLSMYWDFSFGKTQRYTLAYEALEKK